MQLQRVSVYEAQHAGEVARCIAGSETARRTAGGHYGPRAPAPRAHVGGPMTPLIDTFDRVHDNLRISVTDRCNIRCFYCMPEDGVKFQPREEILTFEEIERFVRVAVSLGVRKLRITGGEPLLRKDLP